MLSQPIYCIPHWDLVSQNYECWNCKETYYRRAKNRGDLSLHITGKPNEFIIFRCALTQRKTTTTKHLSLEPSLSGSSFFPDVLFLGSTWWLKDFHTHILPAANPVGKKLTTNSSYTHPGCHSHQTSLGHRRYQELITISRAFEGLTAQARVTCNVPWNKKALEPDWVTSTKCGGGGHFLEDYLCVLEAEQHNNTTHKNTCLPTDLGILDKFLHLSDPLLLTYTLRKFDHSTPRGGSLPAVLPCCLYYFLENP